jgi:hypothetical protein
MKRKIQIESGPKAPDCGNRRSHLDEPCPNHGNAKHTARQCRVLKKLRQPLIAAYRRQMNREPSPNRLVFQIVRTTISPNYPGEELETLDREILVVSTDVPPQDGETEEHCMERENANAARATHQQQELAAAAPAAGQTQLMLGKAMTTSDNKHPQPHQTLSSVNLVQTACVLETS